MTVTYDQNTKARLAEVYGAQRTASIIAGTDPATNRDIAAWNRLCRLADNPADNAARALSERDEKIVRLYRSGVHPDLIGERLGLAAETVARVLRPTFGHLGRGSAR